MKDNKLSLDRDRLVRLQTGRLDSATGGVIDAHYSVATKTADEADALSGLLSNRCF